MKAHERNLELLEAQPRAEEAAAGAGADLLADPQLSSADAEAARELAESHRAIAARLDPDSRLRGLMLRSGGHWSRVGGLPKSFLRQV